MASDGDRLLEIFEYWDYRDFLKATIEGQTHLRGYRTRIAEYLRVKGSFVSQVISKKTHLTLDQAVLLSDFLVLTARETDYFLDLVQFNRAKSEQLREFFKERLMKARRSRLAPPELEDDFELQNIYYSSWHWNAIHLLVGIKEFQDVASISERLKLPPEFIERSLQTMQDFGLVAREGNRWVSMRKNLHAPKGSVYAHLLHSHWRQKAITNIAERDEETVHYTAVYTMSKRDFKRFLDLARRWIKAGDDLVEPSLSEELVVLNLDLFRP